MVLARQPIFFKLARSVLFTLLGIVFFIFIFISFFSGQPSALPPSSLTNPCPPGPGPDNSKMPGDRKKQKTPPHSTASPLKPPPEPHQQKQQREHQQHRQHRRAKKHIIRPICPLIAPLAEPLSTWQGTVYLMGSGMVRTGPLPGTLHRVARAALFVHSVPNNHCISASHRAVPTPVSTPSGRCGLCGTTCLSCWYEEARYLCLYRYLHRSNRPPL